MNSAQVELMREARDSISAARMLLVNGYPGYAASRAYYAMFYVAQAFLEGDGLAFSKHSAVIAAFGREFAATGRVPNEFHRFLIDAQDARQMGDYGPRRALDVQRAEKQIEHAERFLAVAEQLIGPVPPESV